MLPNVEYALPRSSPEQQGIASSAVLQWLEALDSQVHELHSVMLLRHGNVVAEGWWSPYGPEHPHVMFSLSKSFTSTAVGLAVAEGRFSIDDPVLVFFPDEAPAESSDWLKAMRVRHLLSMSSGHAEDTWPFMTAQTDDNWIRAFFDVPVLHAPGTHFLYNTGATYMLAAIVEKTTGLKLVDYLEPRLFAPLGIATPVWLESPQGIAMGGVGLSLKTEDIARFGQLYLQQGRWQGKQLLSEDWIMEATARQVSNGGDAYSDWAQGYGYQFWRCRHGVYRGDGAFGQYCIVMPEQDAVLAITGGIGLEGMQKPLDLVWELLLPALGSAPLADDAASERRLAETLSGLALRPVQGLADSPGAARLSGRTYRVDANMLKVETISLNFSGAVGTLSVMMVDDEETFPWGYGVWQPSQTSVFNSLYVPGLTPVVSSGAWTADDSLAMVARLVETPFFHTLAFHFAGDELMVEIGVNASFEAANTLLTGRLV